MNISQALKEFINKHKELIDDKEFDELYGKTDELLMGDYFDLIILLNSVGINPLKYMTYVPVHYMEKFKELTILKIPEGIKTVERGAFYECSNLEILYLPSTLQSIEGYAFDKCGSLKDVYYNGTKIQFYHIDLDIRNDSLFYVTIHCKDGDVKLG